MGVGRDFFLANHPKFFLHLEMTKLQSGYTISYRIEVSVLNEAEYDRLRILVPSAGVELSRTINGGLLVILGISKAKVKNFPTERVLAKYEKKLKQKVREQFSIRHVRLIFLGIEQATLTSSEQ